MQLIDFSVVNFPRGKLEAIFGHIPILGWCIAFQYENLRRIEGEINIEKILASRDKDLYLRQWERFSKNKEIDEILQKVSEFRYLKGYFFFPNDSWNAIFFLADDDHEDFCSYFEVHLEFEKEQNVFEVVRIVLESKRFKTRKLSHR
jgi:hypothetical protein